MAMHVRLAPGATAGTSDVDRLTALGLTLAAADGGTATADHTVSIEVTPATGLVRSGPVAVLSPAEAATAYEIHVGAALAAASGRAVVHLNGRGRAASLHTATPARHAARAATGWHEVAAPRPGRVLATLDSRPAIIVVPAVPTFGDLNDLVAAHPDADVVVLRDTVAQEHGPAVAQQIFAMVELSLGVAAALPDSGEPAGPRASTRSPFRASDVLHVRLTDSAVEVTNRTAQPIVVRVGLGDRREPNTVLATVQNALDPGTHQRTPFDGAAALDGVRSPRAELRHWSHGDAEVYEGGHLRVLRIQATLGDDQNFLTLPVGNGLDFSLTARELRALDPSREAVEVLPEPAPPAPLVHSVDLLGRLSDALAVAAVALSPVRSARES